MELRTRLRGRYYLLFKKKYVEEALKRRKEAFNEATTAMEKAEVERIEAKIDVLKQKKDWKQEPVPPKRPIGFGR